MELERIEINTISADDTRGIRRAVLRPGLPAAESVYPGDESPASFHLGAFQSGRLVGVATFLLEPCPVQGRDQDWRLRGMATVEDIRGRGVGSLLLSRGIREATARKGTRLWCNGRTSARRFYERHGMRVVGDEFESPNTGPYYLFVVELGAGNASSAAQDTSAN